MKILKSTLLAFAAFGLLFFASCGGDNGGGQTPQEKLIETLKSKQWALSSILLPDVNATEESDWDNFKVTFSSNSMTTSGHPVVATKVWPGGDYSITDNADGIVRAVDGITMHINTASSTKLSVTFTMPPGTEIGGRVAALDGEYTFVLE